MQFEITFDDPETLTKPLRLSLAVNYAADTDMLENVCNETNRDKVHMVGTANRVPLSSAVLAKYSGRYGFREGSRGLPRRLLKFSGGSVTFYATFSTDTAMPSC